MRNIALAAVALLFGAAALQAQDAAPVDSISTLEGVFTEGQVERGEEVFQNVCFECHDTFEFVESGYMGSWVGQPLYDLYDYVRTTMPDDNPGSLRDREYAEVFAYLFSLNGMPVGETRLEGEESLLRRIIIQLPNASTGGSATHRSRREP